MRDVFGDEPTLADRLRVRRELVALPEETNAVDGLAACLPHAADVDAPQIPRSQASG